MDEPLADYLRAVVLGLLQALTEFLPISSSGHLVLAPQLIGDQVSSLTFDVGLHLGTLAAVLVYFWRDWVAITVALLRDVPRHALRVGRWSEPARLGLWIVVGTVPAVIVGALLKDTLEGWFREPVAVAVSLLFFSGVIWTADRLGAHRLGIADVTSRRAVAIGVAQAVALIPGTSRSGITIAAARGLGFDRTAAARFSFLLSAPAVAGAAVLTMGTALAEGEAVAWGPMLVGALTAAAAGMLVIRGLLRYVQTRSLAVFMWYRVALGLAVLAAAAAGLI
ncbi:MAG: undecaprenyl-diphosphate phosphatase [Dehalococcoidia bacterium]